MKCQFIFDEIEIKEKIILGLGDFFWVPLAHFFLHKSFREGQISLHPEYLCPRPSGSALKVRAWKKKKERRKRRKNNAKFSGHYVRTNNGPIS